MIGSLNPEMTSKIRVWTSVAALLAGVSVLAACNVPSNEPVSYDDQNGLTHKNFIAGCTGADPIVDGTTSTLAAPNVCECQYAVFVNNVPYSESDKSKPQYAGYQGNTFVEINNQLKHDGAKFNDNTVIPQAIRDKLNQCKANPASATLPPGFTPGTTVPGTIQGGDGTSSTVGATTPGSALR